MAPMRAFQSLKFAENVPVKQRSSLEHFKTKYHLHATSARLHLWSLSKTKFPDRITGSRSATEALRRALVIWSHTY
jgi:hypothetical protein